MPQTIPAVPPVRVRPLWERHTLFREPEYEHGADWNAEDDVDDNGEPSAAA